MALPSIKNQLVEILVQQEEERALLKVVVPEKMAHTRAFPRTLDVLEVLAPSVLDTKCFNPKGFCFSDEVQNTESAHLLEHLLLDLLVQAKDADGAEACYRGKTRWNWHENPVGTFEVELSVGREEHALLLRVLPQALDIFEKVVESGHKK